MLWSHPPESRPASSPFPYPPCCHLCSNSWPLWVRIALCTIYNTVADIIPFISPATVTASVRQRVTCCGSPSTVWNSMPWVSRFTWAKSMICLYKPTHNHSIFTAKTQKQSRALIFGGGGGGCSVLSFVILQNSDHPSTTHMSQFILTIFTLQNANRLGGGGGGGRRHYFLIVIQSFVLVHSCIAWFFYISTVTTTVLYYLELYLVMLHLMQSF